VSPGDDVLVKKVYVCICLCDDPDNNCSAGKIVRIECTNMTTNRLRPFWTLDPD
jgi:hypothetical protein